MNYEAIALYSQVASSVLFLLTMIWIWMKFIQPAVLNAQQAKNAQIAEAERHRDEAKSALNALQGEIEGARRDAVAIESRAHAQAQAEREVVLREAREAGERTLRSAQGELARSRAAARVALRDELLDQALSAARTQASQQVNDAVNERLVTSFMKQLDHGGTRN